MTLYSTMSTCALCSALHVAHALMCRVIIWACAVDPILNSVFSTTIFLFSPFQGVQGPEGRGKEGGEGEEEGGVRK